MWFALGAPGSDRSRIKIQNSDPLPFKNEITSRKITPRLLGRVST